MRQITSTSDKLTKKNIINEVSALPAGISLILSTLTVGKVVAQATPLTAPTDGKRTICKQAKILTGSTTTVFIVETDTNNFKVGEFIGRITGGLAYAITDITDLGDGTTTITVGTALESATVGEFLYEMAAEATTLDATLNIAYDNDTCTGLTGDATSDALTVGEKQGTASTIVGTIGAAGAGDATVTVSSDLFVDEVLTVALANDDTNLIVAEKFKQALLENETITTYFDILGFQDQVILVLKSVVNGATLKNTPYDILKTAFEVPSAEQVIKMSDSLLRADVLKGVIGSEYLAYLDIKEVKY